MTPEEAIRIIAIMRTADGGCTHCVEALLDEFAEVFPEHAVLIVGAERAQQLIEEAKWKAYCRAPFDEEDTEEN